MNEYTLTLNSTRLLLVNTNGKENNKNIHNFFLMKFCGILFQRGFELLEDVLDEDDIDDAYEYLGDFLSVGPTIDLSDKYARLHQEMVKIQEQLFEQKSQIEFSIGGEKVVLEQSEYAEDFQNFIENNILCYLDIEKTDSLITLNIDPEFGAVLPILIQESLESKKYQVSKEKGECFLGSVHLYYGKVDEVRQFTVEEQVAKWLIEIENDINYSIPILLYLQEGQQRIRKSVVLYFPVFKIGDPVEVSVTVANHKVNVKAVHTSSNIMYETNV